MLTNPYEPGTVTGEEGHAHSNSSNDLYRLSLNGSSGRKLFRYFQFILFRGWMLVRKSAKEILITYLTVLVNLSYVSILNILFH